MAGKRLVSLGGLQRTSVIFTLPEQVSTQTGEVSFGLSKWNAMKRAANWSSFELLDFPARRTVESRRPSKRLLNLPNSLWAIHLRLPKAYPSLCCVRKNAGGVQGYALGCIIAAASGVEFDDLSDQKDRTKLLDDSILSKLYYHQTRRERDANGQRSALQRCAPTSS